VNSVAAYTYSTFVATANVDEWGDDDGKDGDFSKESYVQTGVLVRDDQRLYDAYRSYFDVLWHHTLPASEVNGEEPSTCRETCENDDAGFDAYMKENHRADQSYVCAGNWANWCDHGKLVEIKTHCPVMCRACNDVLCTRGFRANMTALQSDPATALNYHDDDTGLQAFFYPVPNPDLIWDASFNAVAKHVELMKLDDVSATRYFKLNMYHLKGGIFVEKLIDMLGDMSQDLHVRVVYKKDSSEGAVQGFCSGDKGWGTFDRVLANVFPGDTGLRYYDCEEQIIGSTSSGTVSHWTPGSNKPTHAKNYNLVYHNKDTARTEYVTITGSTNGKDDAYNSKANNQLVIVETSTDDGSNPPIYQAHKVSLYKAY